MSLLSCKLYLYKVKSNYLKHCLDVAPLRRVVARYLSNRRGHHVRRINAQEGSMVDSVFSNLPTYSDLTSGESTRPYFLLSVRLIVQLKYA